MEGDAVFILERLTAIPAPLPSGLVITQSADVEVAAKYKVSASVTSFKKPILLVFPAEIQAQPNVVYQSELFAFVNGTYQKRALLGDISIFGDDLLSLPTEGAIFVGLRSTQQAYITACTNASGVFNGVYCGLYTDTLPTGGLSGQSLSAQAVVGGLKMMSINVGNANLSCLGAKA